MKFIISSKYFKSKINEALENHCQEIDFRNGVFHFVAEEKDENVFVSIEKIETPDSLHLKINRDSLFRMIHFLDFLSEQPIVVEIQDFGWGEKSEFIITQTIAKFK